MPFSFCCAAPERAPSLILFPDAEVDENAETHVRKTAESRRCSSCCRRPEIAEPTIIQQDIEEEEYEEEYEPVEEEDEEEDEEVEYEESPELDEQKSPAEEEKSTAEADLASTAEPASTLDDLQSSRTTDPVSSRAGRPPTAKKGGRPVESPQPPRRGLAADAKSASPPEDPLGCYLVYEPEDAGKLVIVWSKTEVQGALAVGKPPEGVEVPGYKFKKKDVLCRAIQSSRQNYFAGWVSFIKAVRVFNCYLKLLPDHTTADCLLPVKLVFHFPDNSLVSYFLDEDNGPAAIITGDADAAAAVPDRSDCLDGVQTAVLHVFVLKARDAEYGDAQSF